MNILVTGACGFIGSNLCAHLLNAGHNVLGFDSLVNASLNPTDRIKKSSGKSWENFKFYQVDIRDLATMKSIVAGYGKIDHIVHLAALGSVPRSFAHPDEVIDVNCKGFANVMMLASDMNCKRIVFASSSSVYGDDQSKLRVEEHTGKQLSPYALSKMQNEQFAEIWCKNIPLEYVGLRFFNVYGQGQLPESKYSAVIPRFINGEKITIYGDGETIRDFTYVDDVCTAIMLSLSTTNHGRIYNVGTGIETNLKKLAALCAQNKKEINHIAERPADIKESVASTWKAEKRLNFKATTSIEDGISYTIAYYESLKNI